MSIISTTATIDRSEDDTAYTIFANANAFRATEVFLGNVFLGITQNGVLVFNNHGIPPRSKIINAELFVTATRNNGVQFDTDIFALGGNPAITARGVWSADTFDAWRPSIWGRFRTIVRDTVATAVFNSDPATNPAGAWAINFEAEKKRSLGALFTVAANTTLGSTEALLSRVGSPTGSLFMAIYLADINGLPSGSALATSDAVAASSLGVGAANRSLINFPFSGLDQIALSTGVNYVATIEEPSYTINGTDFIQWHERRAFFSVGISKHLGIGRQFDYQNFPLHGDVATTANFQRLGSPVNWNVPTFVIGFELSTGLTNLAPVIQECVNEEGYTPGRRIAIVMTGTGEASNRAFASFDHATLAAARLEIDYELDPDGWLPPAEIPVLPIYPRAIYEQYQVDPASAGTKDVSGFVKKAHVFHPGAKQAKPFNPIKRRTIFVPGATQAKVFVPGAKKANVFTPGTKKESNR